MIPKGYGTTSKGRGICEAEGCDKPNYCRNLCSNHYYLKWMKPAAHKPPCSVERCEERSHSLGLCNRHYLRQKKYGDPLTCLKPRADAGKGTHRRRRRHNGKYRQIYQIIWEEHYGPIPKGCVIHHINEDPHDNRIENLALMTNEAHLSLHHRKYPDACRVEGCPTPTSRNGGLGYCIRHYAQIKRNGHITHVLPRPKGSQPCTAQGCSDTRDHGNHLYCGRHYKQVQRHGHVTKA